MRTEYQLWWKGRSLQDQLLKTFSDLVSLIEWQIAWRKRQLGMSLPDSDFYVVVYEKPGDQWPMQRMDLGTANYWSTRSEVPEAYKSDAAILKSLPDGERLVGKAQATGDTLRAIQRIENSVAESRKRFEKAIETIVAAMA